MKKRATVVGVFNDYIATVDAINELRQLGFNDDQLGFVVRSTIDGKNLIGEQDVNVIARGIVSGLLGAADTLLLPLLTSDKAITLQKSNLSTNEEVSNKFPPLSSHKKMPPETLPIAASSAEATLPSETSLERKDVTMPVEGDKQSVQGKRAGIITGGVIGGTLGAVASLQLPDSGPVVAGGVLAAILGSAAPGGLVGGFLSIGIPEQKAHYYEQQFQTGNIIFTIRANGEQQEACDILRHHGALSVEAH